MCVIGGLSLQLYFAARIALMNVIDPQSTTFQRSEIIRLMSNEEAFDWEQSWVSYENISVKLKRAVIASEDATFSEHDGVDWDAIEKAWARNQLAQARVEKINEKLQKKAEKHPEKPVVLKQAKIVGGSTITQQLAKNLFMSPERSLVRKGQEIVLAYMLEGLLSKERILEIYLNNVEWGNGIFGAEAASQYYFRIHTNQLSALQAARLAVMLPAPKRFQKKPMSAYIMGRAAIITARMSEVVVP